MKMRFPRLRGSLRKPKTALARAMLASRDFLRRQQVGDYGDISPVTGLLTIAVGATVTMPPWTPAGDWSYEATINPTVPGCHLLSSVNSEGRLAIADTGVIAGKNVSPANFGDVLVYGFDGSPHTIKIEQVGTTLSAYVDGVKRGEAVGFTLDVGTVDRMFAKWGGATSVPPFYGTVEDITLSADGLSDRIYALELVGEDIQPDSALPDEPLILAGVDHDIDWVLDNPVAEPEPEPEPEPAPNPTANDSVSLLMNEALTINVADTILANDVGWGAGELTASIATQPANGTLADNADGTWTYTPDADYSGADSATVSVTDGTNTEVTTLNITVIDASTLPVVSAATLQTPGMVVDGELATVTGVNFGTRQQAPHQLFDLVGEAYIDGVQQLVDDSGETPIVCGDYRDSIVLPGEHVMPRPSTLYAKSSIANSAVGNRDYYTVVSPPAVSTPRHTGFMGPKGVYRAQGPKGFIGWPYALGGETPPAGNNKLQVAWMLRHNASPLRYFRLHVTGDVSGFVGADPASNYWDFSGADAVTLTDQTAGFEGQTCTGKVIGVTSDTNEVGLQEIHVLVDSRSAAVNLTHGGVETGTISNGSDVAAYIALKTVVSNKILRSWDDPSGDTPSETGLLDEWRTSWTEVKGITASGSNDSPARELAPDQQWSLLVCQLDGDNNRVRTWAAGQKLSDFEAPNLEAGTTGYSPTVALMGYDDAVSMRSCHFLRTEFGEVAAGWDMSLAVVTNNGLFSQSTEFEVQQFTSFPNDGTFGLNLRLGNIAPSDAYLHVLNPDGLWCAGGLHLESNTIYDPNAAPERYYATTDGINDYARLYESSQHKVGGSGGQGAWWLEFIAAVPAGFTGQLGISGNAVTEYLVINADDTVKARTDTNYISVDSLSARWRNGEPFKFRLECEYNDGAGQYELLAKIKYTDNTVDSVVIDTGSDYGITLYYLGRADDIYAPFTMLANLKTSDGVFDVPMDEDSQASYEYITNNGTGERVRWYNTDADAPEFGVVPDIEF